ncbi:MAG: hypothetical protein WC763_05130 [Candidatus Paceibacterota bacterium]|jgi:hypothetical protein
MKPRLEYIEWEDATANSSWFTETETQEWLKGTSTLIGDVGWVLRDDKEYIGLASRQKLKDADTVYGSKWGALQLIPKTWIRKRKKL